MKNRFLTILLAVALSFGLWMYVSLVVSPESEAKYENIPVVMDGTAMLDARDLIIVSDTNLKVDLLLVGNRQDLNKLSNSNITILADLSKITEAGEHNVRYTISYPGTVQSGTIEAKDKQSQYVTVVVAERSKKNIPVEVEYRGSVPENFIADKAVLDHATVDIVGPKNEVDRVDHARIIIDMHDRTMNVANNYRYTLCDAQGNALEDTKHITASATDIQVSIKIDQLKKVKLVYNVIGGGGIRPEDVTITPVDAEQTWITVRGSQAALAALEELNVGTIDLSQVTSSRTIAFSIKMPQGVENFSEVYTVEYNVEIPDLPILQTREFLVSNERFVLENVPEDVDVKIHSQSCRVWLRGPAEALDRLTEDNVRVIVNYAEQDIIMNTYNVLQVHFEIVDENGEVIADVGAVSPVGEDYSYSVNATVTLREEEAGE